MKIKLTIVSLLLLLFCGCKSTTFQDINRGIKVTDRRFFMFTAADVLFEANSNGVSRITVKAESRPDVEAIEAATRGLGEGIAKGVVPR